MVDVDERDPIVILKRLVQDLVKDPEKVTLESFKEEGEHIVSIYVSPRDIGAVIGHKAIVVKALAVIYKSLGGKKSQLEVVEAYAA